MSIKLDFPYYVILKASAGSGKTYVLTERFVYFLLSKDIPKNNIKNILAITFSNNAAYEMKSRILELLKSFYIDNPNNFSKIAERVVDEILSNYSDFQVKTIDSFMTNIFKASAYDFEFNPDVEILMNKDSLTKYAYNLFLKDVGANSDITELFEEMIEILEESLGFMWDPAEEIYQKIKKIYDEVLKAVPRNITFDESLIDKRKNMEIELSNIMEKILQKVNSSGLERNYKNKIFDEFPRILKQRRFVELIEKGVKALPVKKNKELQKVYEEIEALWMRFINLVSEYTELYSRCYYMPYIKIFERFHHCLQQIKKKEGKIFIEDINKYLSEIINTEYVPEIYFRIGAKIYHFFIDEFQDTSLLQWLNLKPLIENSLSEGGSLFVVGDTKQAIYNFRGADYKVMKELEEANVFPSAKKIIEKLNKNYRSRSRIVQFVHDFFSKIIYLNDKYKFAAKLTELDSCEQIPYEDFKEEGYIEVRFLKNEEELKSSLKEIIEDLQTRNYSLRDIAIVASKNTQVEMLSFLLSELGVSFLSYSSLDVRKRKITWEIIHLLQFLDSPLDDFSFSVFIMGDIYKKVLETSKKNIDINEFVLTNREHSPLYKAFEKQFSQLWREHFERLFRLTGYLPIYDLVSEVINSFRLFEIMPEEEATFMKILEIIRYFEQKGVSSIKNFINFFSTTVEDDTIWDITLPVDTEAVKVMTIHKAKGLQFPITIVFLERQRHPKDGMVIEPLEGIFKINENMVEK
ncbi:MAG: UvrD-helicase domain-containing protein, partial [Thermodesulfovibrionaceae bacterium]